MKYSIAAVFYAGVLLLLSGCGFHVQGYQAFPPALRSISIKASTPHSSLKDLLVENFAGVGINTSSDAEYTLNITHESFSTSKSVIGTAQQLNTLGLSYHVAVVLLDKTGKEAALEKTFESSTTYLQNANQILGDTGTTSLLQQELMRNVARQIMRYLASRDMHRALSSRS